MTDVIQLRRLLASPGNGLFEQGKFWQGKIDKKLSKHYIAPMKTVDVTLKAHKQIAKLNKQDMASIYESLEALKD